MRIVVMSDTHRLFSSVQKIIEAQPDADMYIHLGDAEGSMDMAHIIYPDKKFYCVRGNCDDDISLSSELVIPVDEKHSIFATHGHRYGVHGSTKELVEAARRNGCDIVCYGHTHLTENTYSDGMYILNPGSAACPRGTSERTYAFIDIGNHGVFISIAAL
ncbi:metallophosphoesterase [Ruminococcus sp. HUN007]|uniref:YfcE family phosphodiesterase n=1 Tax=Ruminococcus sp. HUN007 TaxID=1514668 RepID=UPI0005D29845|nr:metallophosphoesterase [Ruminococcus sp. HUN007]